MSYPYAMYILSYNIFLILYDYIIIGGQQTIRSYWRNYFEATDGLIWVIDSADKRRLADCKKELMSLLQQERLAGVSSIIYI